MVEPGSAEPDLVYQAGGAVRLLVPGAPSLQVAPELKQDQQHPDWSPDGTALAFDSNFTTAWTTGLEEPARELFGCEAPCANVFDEAWSPDGREIAFVRVLGDGVHTASAQVVAIDLATAKERILHEDAAGDVWLYQPRWSPDGTRLLVEWDQFASNLLDEDTVLRQELRVIGAGDGHETRVPGTRAGTNHDWSPIDDLIVVEQHGNLVTMRPDGADRTEVTHYDSATESAIQPTFTPDGTGVVFTWVHGVQGSGTETTTAAVVTLSDLSVTEIAGTEGATHARLQPTG